MARTSRRSFLATLAAAPAAVTAAPAALPVYDEIGLGVMAAYYFVPGDVITVFPFPNSKSAKPEEFRIVAANGSSIRVSRTGAKRIRSLTPNLAARASIFA